MAIWQVQGEEALGLRATWPGRLWAEVVADLAADQSGRLFLWSPVILAWGIACYFALPREPAMVVFMLVGVVAAALAALAALGRAGTLAFIVALFLAGFCAAKLRAELVRSPALAASTGKIELTGTVLSREASRRGRERVVVAVERIEGLRRGAWPMLVRMSAGRSSVSAVEGDRIKVTARLYPLPTPTSPGGYDPARGLWFEGIGATGVAVGRIEPLAGADARPRRFAPFAQLRAAIDERIATVLPGDEGAVAQALITGTRGRISDEDEASLRASGLAHILSISGLHMSLVGGGVFFVLRAGLAAFPGVALRWPIKKWAAVGALLVSALYLGLSGAAVATQRSFIMLAVMFIAILFDRPALSMRNLALAAIVVLLAMPEALLSAGFQMSFLAVLGLVAAHEAAAERRARRGEPHLAASRIGRIVRSIGAVVLAAAVTSLVAGLFTALPGAFHFNRIALYGLLGNLLAIPIVSLIVMPMALAAVAAMPLGLEALPLMLMGEGLELLQWVSDRVAELPGSTAAVPDMPGAAALFLTAAGIWACLGRGRMRGPLTAGLLACGLGLLWIGKDRPAVLIERSARNVSIRNDAGALVPALPRRGAFAIERWLLSDGDAAKLGDAQKRPGWTCAEKVCRAEVSGRSLFFLQEGATAPADCGDADIVVADYPLREACLGAGMRIDRFDVWRHGAHALFIDENGGLRVERADALRGERPWVTRPIARRLILSPPEPADQDAADAPAPAKPD